MAKDEKEYTEADRKEYEAGQKDGSESGVVRTILGPGFVSEAYQAGFNNGADNQPDDDD